MKNSKVSNRVADVWREGLVLLLGSSLTIMGSVMVAPVLPKLSEEFSALESNSHILVPLVMTGPALAIGFFAPVAGWLADRLGRKNLLIIALFCYALLGATPALLNSLSDILIARLLFGCAEAAVITCCTTLIADYWVGEQRMSMINRQVVSIGAIGAVFFVVGGAAGEYGWRVPFYLYLLPLLLAPWMFKLLWEPKRIQVEKVQAEVKKISMSTLLIGYFLIFGGMVLNFVVPVQTPRLLVSIGVTSTTMIGLSAGFGLVATLLGSLIWPAMRRALGIKNCNALLLFLGAVGLWLLGNAQSYNDVLLAVFIHGVGGGMLLPNAMTPVMNTLNTNNRGRGLGVFTACLCLGQFSSPLVIVLFNSFGLSLPGAIHAVGFIALAGAVVWVFAAVFWAKRASVVNTVV